MLNTIKIPMILVVFTLLISQPTLSYAWGHGYQGHGYQGHFSGGGFHGHGYYHSYIGLGFNYVPGPYYYDPGYYYPGYYDPGILVSQPVVQTSNIIVQPSTTVVTTAANYETTDDSFIINIPNSAGGFTSVLIKKSGNGFIGPQGEYYPEFPRVSQLKVMYGRQKNTRS